jgi:hypothetical protein
VASSDADVPDDVELYRLVHPEHGVTWDEDENRWRPSSAAFQNPTKPVKTDRMSVVLGDTLEECGRLPEDARRSKPDWWVVALTAAFVRQEEQEVERDPTGDEPAHGSVVGEKKPPRRSRFAEAARWIVEPPTPP